MADSTVTDTHLHTLHILTTLCDPVCPSVVGIYTLYTMI